MFDTFFFAVFPYLSVAIAIVGGIWRYRSDRFSYSSQSSHRSGGGAVGNSPCGPGRRLGDIDSSPI